MSTCRASLVSTSNDWILNPWLQISVSSSSLFHWLYTFVHHMPAHPNFALWIWFWLWNSAPPPTHTHTHFNLCSCLHWTRCCSIQPCISTVSDSAVVVRVWIEFKSICRLGLAISNNFVNHCLDYWWGKRSKLVDFAVSCNVKECF